MPGRSEGDGEGFGADQTDYPQVHADEGKHSGGQLEDYHPQVAELDGAGDEGCHQGHVNHEQVRQGDGITSYASSFRGCEKEIGVKCSFLK